MEKTQLQQLIESLVAEELNDMAIRQFKTVGDWNKSSSFRDKTDRALLTNPKAVQKIQRQWSKTPYDFNMYLVNDPRVNKSEFREVGVRSLSTIRDGMKLTSEEVPDPGPGEITIIYTGNFGDQRKMASGWILAHRFGHALAASRGTYVGNEWNEFTSRLKELVAEILQDVYGINVSEKERRQWGGGDKILKYVARQLGTMKSARDNNMRSWYEFAYELLAQYLITGKIKFNPLPDRIVTGIAGWGRKETRGVHPDAQGIQQTYNNHDLEYYAQELEQMLENVLDRAMGNIFVM